MKTIHLIYHNYHSLSIYRGIIDKKATKNQLFKIRTTNEWRNRVGGY